MELRGRLLLQMQRLDWRIEAIDQISSATALLETEEAEAVKLKQLLCDGSLTLKDKLSMADTMQQLRAAEQVRRCASRKKGYGAGQVLCLCFSSRMICLEADEVLLYS